MTLCHKQRKPQANPRRKKKQSKQPRRCLKRANSHLQSHQQLTSKSNLIGKSQTQMCLTRSRALKMPWVTGSRPYKPIWTPKDSKTFTATLNMSTRPRFATRRRHSSSMLLLKRHSKTLRSSLSAKTPTSKKTKPWDFRSLSLKQRNAHRVFSRFITRCRTIQRSILRCRPIRMAI